MSFNLDLKSRFENPALDLSSLFSEKAIVAVLLFGSSWQDLELAFIRRSISETDRWSGQVAFPGGRFEEADETPFRALQREVFEEIGVTLHPSQEVGRLDDIQARKRGEMLPFYIRPLVLHLNEKPFTKLNSDEVADFFWIRIQDLRDPARATVIRWEREGQKLDLPALSMPGDPPLWGLTYLMTQNLFSLLPSFFLVS